MRRLPFSLILLVCILTATQGWSQSGKGAINGVLKDQAGAVLQGARIEMKPQLRPVTTNSQGEFTIADVPTGTYAVTVSYVGFAPFTTSVTVEPGQSSNWTGKYCAPP
jgi:hypothetical protein